ncbi:PREDICTED: uncharacterized protein LOC102860495 [Elephantulus edwardii]|uniref:uncharacterized protein LOC102860495 n=1 Tax=Elephantulus edwardii TaxID=28737 RepID=UPI0003F0BF43|nr:PREDICTED: uncharacterized protein LOC102860495 [Elephantulus edwardii]
MHVSQVPENHLQVQWYAPGSWPLPETYRLKYQLRYKRCKAGHFLQTARHHSTFMALYQSHQHYMIQKAKLITQLLDNPVGKGECVQARQGPEWDPSLQVQCRASRYPISIDCSWTHSPATEANVSTHFITTYRVGMDDSKPCNQSIPGSLSCSISDFMNFSKLPHVLNITAIHPGGITTNLLTFVPDNIKSYRLKYQLRYKGCKAEHFLQVGPIEHTNLTIELMHLKGNYCIQVNAQDLLGHGEPNPSLQVQCRASRYPVSIDCSWTQSPAPEANMSNNFITTYRVGMEDSKPCNQSIPGSLSCSISDFMNFSKLPHVLNVTAIHPTGISTNLLTFVPDDIIKPDPPVIMHVSQVSENHLQVQWNAPGSWPLPGVYGLKYQLRYKRCKAEHFLQVGPTDQTNLTIELMHLKGNYCIQVNAQELLGHGEPSEWSPSTVYFIPPDPSQQVQCRASRYPNGIDCSWTQSPAPKANMSTNFITTYRVGMEDSKPCNQLIPGSLSCSISDFMNFSKLPHVLRVTAIHPSCTSTTLLTFVPDEIIKPDPPVNIRVSRIPENYLRVQWNPPGSWPLPETYRLKYQLRYRRCKAKHYWQVGPTEDTTLTIKLAHSKGKYCIQVNAQHYLDYGEPNQSLKVQCRSSNYPVSIECSWIQSPAPMANTPTKFITTYRVGKEDNKPCYQLIPGSHTCTILDFVKFSKLLHKLNVTAIHPGGVSTTLLSFVPDEIKTYKLKYQLRYKLCNAKHFLQMGPTQDTTLIIKSLQPKSKYCIQVNAQHGFGYGEPTAERLRTEAERAHQAPSRALEALDKAKEKAKKRVLIV